MAFIFRTFYDKNGRKFCKIGKEIILMESTNEDKIQDLCKQFFKKFRIQFFKVEKPTFMLTVEPKTDTTLFEEKVLSLFNNAVRYDIIRSEF